MDSSPTALEIVMWVKVKYVEWKQLPHFQTATSAIRHTLIPIKAH